MPPLEPSPRRAPLLVERYPGISGRLPWRSLGDLPTPVAPMDRLSEHLGLPRLYVKRDDLTGTPYGGNKLRKLELLLADALARGAKAVVTFGAVGSNHVLATTVYARALGLDAIGVCVPQPNQAYVAKNIRAVYAAGGRIVPVGAEWSAPSGALGVMARRLLDDGRLPSLVLPGGSSPLGSIGYVEAGLEIAADVDRGVLPTPDLVAVAAGSGGTMAGLMVGLSLAGLRSKVLGIRVYDVLLCNEKTIAALATATSAFLAAHEPSLRPRRFTPREVLLDHGAFGKGYARFTARGQEAVELARRFEGLHLEGSYTGKALAAVLERLRAPAHRHETILFVDTYNSAPLDALGTPPPDHTLPDELQPYLSGEVSPIDP